MDSSTEEISCCRGTLLALLDFLVDPLLPSRLTLRETIPLSQQELVAKQVHAVVVLYNYYQRKHNPGLEFLEFQSFCKLALDLKPSLQLYLRVAPKTEDLSVTEEAIKSACDTCKSLDASNNNPIIDGWPVSKVSIFLVDSRKENCVLFHSSITQGVWSVIEKEVNVANQESEALMEARSVNKNKRVMKRMDAIGLQQLAYLAVKETCGINQADLKILDNHLVYSTSKPKTTAQLYIMQCTQTNQNMNMVPINDVMDSLQGSLIDKESVTAAVEYFHLLPFADKVLDWLESGGREMSQDSSQRLNATKEDGNCISSPRMDKQLDPYHFDIVKNIETRSGSHSEEPLSSISKQHCTIFHGSGELALNISESFETTKEVRIGSSCHLKEESIAVAPKHGEVSEARNHNSHHLEEKFSDASEARIGNSQHLEGKSFMHASQASEVQAEFQNARSFCLNKQLRPCISQNPESEKGVQNLSIYRRKEHPVVYKKRNRSPKKSTSNKVSCTVTSNELADYPRQEAEQCGATGSSNSMDINGKRCIYPCEEKLILSVQETDQAALTGQAIVVAEFPDAYSNGRDVEKALSYHQIIDAAVSDDAGKQGGAIVPYGSDFEHLHQMQLAIASEDPSVSKTVLKALLRKREQLSQQLRNIADEFALCEGKFQTILRDGEDQSVVKIDTHVDGCNEVSLQTAGGARENTTLYYNYLDLSPVVKRKKLSEANMSVLSPCQELDGICTINLWMIPTYILSPLEGGFQATVNVKGVDFDCSSEGATCTTPHEARNSAASKVLAELRSLAAKS